MATQTPLSERDARFERVRARMREEGFDALLIGGKGHWWTGRGYVRYLSDFHLWGHDALIVFPVEGEPALTVSSYAVARMIASRGWITDSAGDVFLVPRTLSALRQRGLERGRLGTVGTPFIMSADLHRELGEQLPHADIGRADEILDRVRVAKSEIEIFQNRELWSLAKQSMERFSDVLRPDHSQLELSAEATKVALAGGARDVLVLMGESPAEYGPPRDEPVRCSDVLRYHMEICGPSGHWCELTLTFSFRPLSDSEERLLASELTAYRAVQAAARPGARLAQLAKVFEDTLSEDGWELGEPTQHFDFHGQGMDVIEYPWFAAEQPWGGSRDFALEPGSILSYHPARTITSGPMWSPGVSDNLLITETGAEWLSGDWSHDWEVRA
jgi:Xaa-Pro aminopeptidase